MGHTVYPMRYVIYDKMGQLKKFAKALREPERSCALSLINHVYQNISAITYVNPYPHEIEDNMIYSMLVQEKHKNMLEIEDLTLYLFSLMVFFKVNQLKNPDERNLNRLLQKPR